MRKHLPSKSTIIATLALFVSLQGGAMAAGVEHIGTGNIQNGAVTAAKLSKQLRAELADLSGYTNGQSFAISVLQFCEQTATTLTEQYQHNAICGPSTSASSN